MTKARPRTTAEVLALARPFLAERGVEAARLEAELLVAHALALTRLELYLALERPVSDAELDAARALLVRRAKGEPTAYLIGAREFYGRSFAVTPAVLIPRPETELLVDLARERFAGRAAPRIAELGTGSGCIAVTLALELPAATVAACEVSAAALAVARANRDRLLGSDAGRVALVEGDGFAALGSGPFDLVVSNPPYVDPDQSAELAASVRDHEPGLALFAPRGSVDHWAHALVEAAPRLLAPDGVLLVELGADQARRLRPWCAERGLVPIFHTDLGGHERVLEWRAGGKLPA
ncbi:MAG: peptide chain release factor N(5)-glutamine methyltransferase [Planctomycetes bacterium]|nr:peptide chain release factor N(5)-glutamine methyltransferase [Planctomycetota bacterium]